MLNEIGSPATMAERPDIKDKWPASVVPELPEELEREIMALVDWLRSSIQRVSSATGPGSTSKNLPWFGNGIQGFLRKLWYGDHPDNPSYSKEEVQPLVVRKLTLKEYKELEIALDHCIGETLLCEAATPTLDQIMQQFAQKLKQLVLTHVVKNGAVRPPASTPEPEPKGDDVRPIGPEDPTEPDKPPPPDLEPKTPGEQQAKDEVLSQKDMWQMLARKIIEELPSLKDSLKGRPNNFSDFRDAINAAMRDGQYKPAPLLAMCFRKPELYQTVYQVLMSNWHRLDDNEDEEPDWSNVPEEMLGTMDDEEKAVLRHIEGLDERQRSDLAIQEIKNAAQQIVDMVGDDPDAMYDKLKALIIQGDEGVKRLPPSIRVLLKSQYYSGKEVSQNEKLAFADTVKSGLEEDE